MIFKSKILKRFLTLGLLSIALTACQSNVPTRQVAPTVQVVAFATAKPTTPAPTKTPRLATATPIVTKIAPTATPTKTIPTAPPIDATTMLNNRPADQNPLTGLTVTNTALLQRRPIMVRIGNDPVTRPQMGLDKADMVYEELVEGWITRFTAVYLTNDPPMIGPIRSARLINVQLTPQYQAALAHSGGSDPVRWELSQLDIVNFDEFFTPQPFVSRPNEGWQTRLHFNAKAARDYMTAEKMEKAIKLRGFVFSDKLDLNFDTANEITVPYTAQVCDAKWVYDTARGQYLRFMGGDIFTNPEGQQIGATNVLIYFADHQKTDIVEDITLATSTRIIVNGRGKVWLARDGKILKGNWETNGQETPLFTFDNGQPMPLKPGNSWVEVVPLDYEITVDGKTAGLQNTPNTPTPNNIPTTTPIGFRGR